MKYNEIYQIDCIDGLNQLHNEIDAIFTSPPYNIGINYDGVYNDKKTHDKYLEWTEKWAKAAYGAVREGGVMGVNVADVTHNGKKTTTSVDVMKKCIEAGWTYQEHIIWQKPAGSGQPRNLAFYKSLKQYQIAKELIGIFPAEKRDAILRQVKKKLAKVYYPRILTEDIWVFSKGEKITTKVLPGLNILGSIISGSLENITNNEEEWIEASKETIKNRTEEKALTKINKFIVDDIAEQILRSAVGYMKYKHPKVEFTKLLIKYKNEFEYAIQWSFKNIFPALTDVWYAQSGVARKRQTGHPVPFDIKLAMRFIVFYTPEHGIICDPFMGSGTTACAAVRLNKCYNTNYNYLGFELSPKYIQKSQNSIQKEKQRRC